MHHGLLGGCGQGRMIPISRAVSRLMGTSCTMDCLEGMGKDT